MTDKATAAFPCPMSEQTYLNQECEQFQRGMSLRDYFAAKAMQVYMQNTNSTIDDDAKHAYAMADAMLRAREGV